MCEADSADPRVEASVRQVSQLAATIEADNPLVAHITIPCIIVSFGESNRFRPLHVNLTHLGRCRCTQGKTSRHSAQKNHSV
ncbi:hypothetical protein B0J17DRAFT_660361, partial [Rhizoctonia solani]